MVREKIDYKDYDGNMRSETFMFNLNQAEISEMQLSTVGGLTGLLQRAAEAQDAPTLIKIFKEFILKAYGVKSPDGRRFEKSEELSREFSQTEAYSKLFMRMATDADYAARFIRETANVPEEEQLPVPASVSN